MNNRIGFTYELKIWAIYFAILLFTVYIHEVGHCIPAWTHGYGAVPTPAKEYISQAAPLELKPYTSLGGIIGSILVTLVILIACLIKTYRFNSVMLAGAIAIPGIYTLKFIVSGRGHDATEFQEAQSVLGLNYSGHSLDWIFLLLFLFGVAIWIIKSKPNYKIIGRLSIGFVLTIAFIVGLQVINNAIFDPIFQTR